VGNTISHTRFPYRTGPLAALIWIKGLAIPSAFVVFADIWSDKDAIQSLYANRLDEVADGYQYDHRFYCVRLGSR
jgi:hypothetical protein